MAGEAAAAWVAYSMAVDEEEVGLALELLEGGCKRGELAEGEKARDIWERGGKNSELSLDNFESICVTDHYCRNDFSARVGRIRSPN